MTVDEREGGGLKCLLLFVLRSLTRVIIIASETC